MRVGCYHKLSCPPRFIRAKEQMRRGRGSCRPSSHVRVNKSRVPNRRRVPWSCVLGSKSWIRSFDVTAGKTGSVICCTFGYSSGVSGP